MVIYKTTNLINGKFYVGKDEKNNPDYLGSGLLLNRAISKHGLNNFKKEILETCINRKELNEREIYWIKELKAIEIGYNIALGGAGGDTYTNNPNLPEIIEKLSGENNHFYGKKHTSDSKDKIGETKLGKPSWNSGKIGVYSKKSLEKMRNARLKMTGETSSNFVKVDKDELTELLLVNTINETAKKLNISVSCVRRKIKDFCLDYLFVKKTRKEKNINVGKIPNYYKISDELFNEILWVRNKDKKTIEELAKIYKIGINKLRAELKKRTGIERLKRIRQ